MDINERIHKLINDEEYAKKEAEKRRQLVENYKIPHDLGKLEVIPEPKKEIKFWIDLLSNSNLDDESISLINKCLQNELKCYLNPIV